MDFFKKIFGNTTKQPSKILNLEEIEDINGFIIELDNRISENCNWGSNLEKLTSAQRIFFLNQNLEREVNNGGFNQFFYNSSGNFSDETVTALKTINALHTAMLLKTAIAAFHDSLVPQDRELRQELMESFNDEALENWMNLIEPFTNIRITLMTLILVL